MSARAVVSLQQLPFSSLKPTPSLGGSLSDDLSITFKNFDLTVSAVVHIADPPGTYATHPEDPISLADALLHGLKACGLEARFEDVFEALRAHVEPGFNRTVAEFEELRRRTVSSDNG